MVSPTYPATTSLLIQKHLQYVEEVTRNITPTAPTFTHAGPVMALEPSLSDNSVDYRMLGSEDIYKVIPIGQRYSFDITYNPIDRNLLEYAINLTGTRNRYKSLSMLYSQLMNNAGTNVEKFVLLKGCQCDSTTIDITLESVEVSQTWIANEITTPATTSGLTTPTYAGAITATPWTGMNGGSSSLVFNAVDDYKLREMSIEIENNIDQIQPIGETLVQWAQPTMRDITGSFDVIYKDDLLLADAKSATPRTMTYTLDTSSSTVLTFTDVYLKEYEEAIEADSGDAKTQSFTFTAKSLNIAGT